MRHLLLAAFLSFGTLFAQTTLEISETVYFGSSADKLDRSAKKQIAAFTERLAGYADFSLKLEAYTDEQGTTEYNEQLAARRAASVKNYLKSTDVAIESWSVATYGERLARTNTTEDAQRKQDRRVDLQATVTVWSDLSEVTTALREDLPQQFTITGTEQQTIRGEKGGRFLIEANSLVDEQGNPVSGPINVSLVEAYSLSDMLLAGLTTTSGERTLETGGMFQLTATDEAGNPLFLADGKTIASAIPTEDYNEQMRIFNGQFHDEEEEQLDWSLTPQQVQSSWGTLFGNRYDGPMLIRWEVDGKAAFASWKKANPEPTLSLRPVPSNRKVPQMPDTSAIRWEPSLVDGLFASGAKRKRMRAALVDKAMARFKHEQEVYRKRVQLAKENAAFNLAARKEFPNLEKAWEDAAAAERDRIANVNKAKNDALKADYDRRVAAWRAKREATLEAALSDDDLSGKGDDLNRYFFTINQLGWINCDIFYEEEDPIMVNALIPAGGEGTKAILIPEGRSAMLPYFFREAGTWSSNGIPRGTQYMVVAYQIIDGQLQYAQQEVAAAAPEPEQLSFRPVSVEELKASLVGLKAAN